VRLIPWNLRSGSEQEEFATVQKPLLKNLGLFKVPRYISLLKALLCYFFNTIFIGIMFELMIFFKGKDMQIAALKQAKKKKLVFYDT
jgi:hypothetical protein